MEEVKEFNDEAHEIFAMAQLSSGDGIEDGAERIRKRLIEIVYKEIHKHKMNQSNLGKTFITRKVE